MVNQGRVGGGGGQSQAPGGPTLSLALLTFTIEPVLDLGLGREVLFLLDYVWLWAKHSLSRAFIFPPVKWED